jgi:two-component system, NtrC family, response regulator AtoC
MILRRSELVTNQQIDGPAKRCLHLLVCDDEEIIRWSLSQYFRKVGYEVTEASDGKEGLLRVAESVFDLVVTDLKMPNMAGLEFLRELRCQGYEMPAIVLTAYGAVQSAVEATQLGAVRYIGKPFELKEVHEAVDNALTSHRVDIDTETSSAGYGSLIGVAPKMLDLFRILERLEDIPMPTVMITGESGTGKGLVARAIHAKSTCMTGPLVQVDCASLPEQLIESELFGHERGAFTDAKALKRGMFEVANGGTIFLDEIGEMSIAMQARLLRVLEERTFRRVGGTATLQFNAAVVAATNVDLRAAVANGSFREDLYFRLGVIQLEVPPLRERWEDLPLLVRHFVDEYSRAYRKNVEEITGRALAKLADYSWPGNVRELRNVIERIIILEAKQKIDVEQLPPEIRFGKAVGKGTFAYILPEEGVDLEAVERGLIEQAMDRTGGNQSAASRLLGITRYALRYRLEKYSSES